MRLRVCGGCGLVLTCGGRRGRRDPSAVAQTTREQGGRAWTRSTGGESANRASGHPQQGDLVDRHPRGWSRRGPGGSARGQHRSEWNWKSDLRSVGCGAGEGGPASRSTLERTLSAYLCVRSVRSSSVVVWCAPLCSGQLRARGPDQVASPRSRRAVQTHTQSARQAHKERERATDGRGRALHGALARRRTGSSRSSCSWQLSRNRPRPLQLHHQMTPSIQRGTPSGVCRSISSSTASMRALACRLLSFAPGTRSARMPAAPPPRPPRGRADRRAA